MTPDGRVRHLRGQTNSMFQCLYHNKGDGTFERAAWPQTLPHGEAVPSPVWASMLPTITMMVCLIVVITFSESDVCALLKTRGRQLFLRQLRFGARDDHRSFGMGSRFMGLDPRWLEKISSSPRDIDIATIELNYPNLRYQ